MYYTITQQIINKSTVTMSRSITSFFTPVGTTSPDKKRKLSSDSSSNNADNNNKQTNITTDTLTTHNNNDIIDSKKQKLDTSISNNNITSPIKSHTSNITTEELTTLYDSTADYDRLELAIPLEWRQYLYSEFKKSYWSKLKQYLSTESAKHTVYPAKRHIFRALQYCTPENIKVVIVGQDPYHGTGQAEGLCFSVPHNIAIPSSLRNIYKGKLYKSN